MGREILKMRNPDLSLFKCQQNTNIKIKQTSFSFHYLHFLSNQTEDNDGQTNTHTHTKARENESKIQNLSLSVPSTATKLKGNERFSNQCKQETMRRSIQIQIFRITIIIQRYISLWVCWRWKLDSLYCVYGFISWEKNI